MSNCPSCGGVIGRDCFNPQECAEITKDMARQINHNISQEIEVRDLHIKQLQAENEKLKKINMELAHSLADKALKGGG